MDEMWGTSVSIVDVSLTMTMALTMAPTMALEIIIQNGIPYSFLVHCFTLIDARRSRSHRRRDDDIEQSRLL
jgi:hypothetical protein